jgi:hypothetical protein
MVGQQGSSKISAGSSSSRPAAGGPAPSPGWCPGPGSPPASGFPPPGSGPGDCGQRGPLRGQPDCHPALAAPCDDALVPAGQQLLQRAGLVRPAVAAGCDPAGVQGSLGAERRAQPGCVLSSTVAIVAPPRTPRRAHRPCPRCHAVQRLRRAALSGRRDTGRGHPSVDGLHALLRHGAGHMLAAV